jgi:hypothetical protein
MLSKFDTLKTQTARVQLLSNALKSLPYGELTADDNKIMLEIFEENYTPDEGERKYETSEIECFFKAPHPIYHNDCFQLRLKDGSTDVATVKRLAGGNRTSKANLVRALRRAIDPQIQEFKEKNPLNFTAVCPIKGIPLGKDAEVDHYDMTFKDLAQEWLKTTPNPKFYASTTEKSVYELEEPFKASWKEFHRHNTNLRWLSKEANKIAHKC